MLQNLGGAHLVAIVFLIVLLFGAPKLPLLAKNLGQSMRIFKREVSTDDGTPDTRADDAEPASPAQSPAVPNDLPK